MGYGKRLPFDGFEVTYISYETMLFETEWIETEEVTEAPATTEAPAGTEAQGTNATTDAPKSEGGCGSVIGASAIVFAAILAAPVAFANKRK